MTTFMRRTVRGTAAGLGALAIIAGAAACGGGSETETKEPSASEEKPAEAADEPAEAADPAETEEDGAAATEEGDGAASTDEGDGASEGDPSAAGEPLSEEDLTTAGDRAFEFLQAAAGGDGEAACSLITNPLNGQPFEGKDLEDCVASFGESSSASGVDPAVADMMERSMIEAVDKGDGTAGINALGSDAGLTMLKADDGQWYIDGSAAAQQQAG